MIKYDLVNYCSKEAITLPKDKFVLSKSNKKLCPFCGYPLRTKSRANKNRIIKDREKRHKIEMWLK